jgi:predicted GIY-YIG superfamily endonuclease
MTKFFYVYILQSEADPQRFYAGLTNDLRLRLRAQQFRTRSSHRKTEAVVIENIRCTSRSDPGGSARALSEIRFRSCLRKTTFLIQDLRLVVSFSTFIFDLRFAIVDLSKCARSAPVVPNRKSAIEIQRFRGAAAIPGL